MNKIITDIDYLRCKSKPTTKKEGLEIGRKLFSILNEHNRKSIIQGIGLSAIQIGIKKRVFVLNIYKPEIWINPEIIGQSLEEYNSEESCLSLPGVKKKKKRKLWLLVSATNQQEQLIGLDVYNTEHIYKTNNFDILRLSAWQHEYDHLLGKLIID